MDGNTFSFEGLDDGDYVLTETKTPEGYVAIDPIEFTVTADHQIIWDGADRTSVLTSLNGDVTTGELDLTADKDAGSRSGEIVNEAEIKVTEEKIEDARKRDDDKQKYQLMRIKEKLEAEMQRVNMNASTF